MVYRTHTATSGSLALLPVFLPSSFNPYIGMPLESFIIGFFVVLVFSLMPDLDEPESYLSKRFPFYFVSHLIALFTKHRGITHNFIFSIVFFIFLYFATWNIHSFPYFNTIFIMAFIAYIGHIIGDSMTIGGIQRAYYPFSKSTFWIVPKWLRFKTGSFFEEVLFILIFCFFSLEIAYFLHINDYISQYLGISY